MININDFTIYTQENGVLTGVVSKYAKFSMVLRHNDRGTFAMTLGGAEGERLTEGTKILVLQEGYSDPLFRGTVMDYGKEVDGGVTIVKIAGYDDMELLRGRVAEPDPLNGPPFSLASHDVRTGPAETLIHQYAKYNFGPSARSERKIAGITFAADLGRGTTLTKRARLPNLLEWFREIALEGGGLGFTVSGGVFSVYMPVDRSDSVVFSDDLGNLRKKKWRVRAPEANFIYGGGDGELTARRFRTVADSYSVLKWGRIEGFYDRRNAASNGELDTALAGQLETKGEKAEVGLEVTQTQGMTYRRDYNLGDTVTVVLEQGTREITDVIREVQITLEPGAVRVVPVVGTTESRSEALLQELRSDIKLLKERLSFLERTV